MKNSQAFQLQSAHITVKMCQLKLFNITDGHNTRSGSPFTLCNDFYKVTMVRSY